MAVVIQPDAEPIPGYRLIERLGSGGFGEVWKAEAPGGLFKAIKFVQRGNSRDESMAVGGETDPDRSRADQELKSLSRVKTVHHPYIISLDRFEIVDDYLVIVMELADRTLADRFKQCRGQGLPGLPREELLNYLYEAAEALDLMNSMYQLQHLDIKPQNLFLVHNHIKVADFGLVKDITDQKFMTITGGVTPVYAAPETFDGKFSRQSDQYSLAIVYQETLTGQRPFTGTTMKQLILQHLQNAHDLTPLPVHDRQIIARALSKNPEDRFATCQDFVQALKKVKSKNRAQESGPATAKAASEPAFPSANNTIQARGGAGPIKPVQPNFTEKEFFGDSVPIEQVSSRALPSAPRNPSVKLNKPAPALAKPKAPPPAPVEPTGVVQPALVIGMGQVGLETLSNLRQSIATNLGSASAVPHVRLLAIDTDPAAIQKATVTERAMLRTQETFLARLQRPSHYLKTRDGHLPTDSWLNPKLIYRIPREQTGAGLRALGRLAFIDNYRPLAKRLEGELHALTSQDTPHDTCWGADLGLRTVRPRVYLVTSLTGNTGGGMFLDIAYLVRRLLNEQGHEDAEIVGLFFLPAVQREIVPAAALANTYAALVELQHYSRADSIYSAHCETAASTAKGERVSHMGAAVQRCVLAPLPDYRGAARERQSASTFAQAGEYLYRDLATPLGKAFDAERASLMKKIDDAEIANGPLLEAIGMSRVLWPRQALLRQAGRRLCCQLVTRWMQKTVGAMAEVIRPWTQECWESLGMRPENLIERFQQMSEHALQQKPELLLAEVLGPAQEILDRGPKDAGKTKTIINMGPIVETFDQLDKLLGIPEEIRNAKQIHAEPALMERAFSEIALVIADECEQKLAEVAVTLLEDPHYRLAGAEEALRQFCTTVEQALRSQEVLAKELADKAAQLHVRIQQWLDKPLPANAPTSTQWSFGLTRRGGPNSTTFSPAELFELFRTYTKTRYHSIVLAHLNQLYVGLRGHLSDQIREVGFCRQRLGELHGLLQSSTDAGAVSLKTDRVLFSPGCVDLNSSVNQLLEQITMEDLINFDERMQAWIKIHCQALLQVCMGSATAVKNLAPAMLLEAEDYLGERLTGNSVAEMYLTRRRAEHGEAAEERIVDDLQSCLDDATPALGRIKTGTEVSIVTLPNNAPGVELQKMLAGKLGNARVVLSDRDDEMLFYHEIVSIRWTDLDQLGPIAQKIYEQRCAADPSALHTREDVFDWQLIAASHR